MSSPWYVITETSLIAQVQEWGKEARRQLFAVQDLFREDGPEAFDLFADTFTGSRSWEQLSEPCALEFFVQTGRRYLWIELEILPGKTIVFRRAKRE